MNELVRHTFMSGLLLLMVCAGVGQAFASPPDDDLLAAASHAEREQRYVFSIHWENDGGLLKRNRPRDRYYTNGLALSIAHRPQWAEQLAPHMPFADAFGPARTAAGYTVGQLMFTPRDIDTTRLLEDDRPYAGYLYTGVYWQRANEHTLDHFQLDIGLVGPSSLAEDVQEFVHRHYHADDPKGWRHQLRDEPTIQLNVRKKWRLNVASLPVGNGELDLQWIPQVGAALGTVHRQLEAGSILRLGGNLPDDFGPARIRDLAAVTGSPGQGWGGYVFAGAGARLVEHNLFLDGNTWRNSHSISHEPLVGEARWGCAIQYRGETWTGELAYSQTFQTDEFKGQRGGHEFATLTVAFGCVF